MNKKERIIFTIFMLWMTIFVGLSWINIMNFNSTIHDLKSVSILIFKTDFNPINGLIFGIIFNTITSQSETTYLYLNFSWFGILIFGLVFNILFNISKKMNKKNL